MLELYQFEGCPFCVRVRRKLSDLGLDWVSRTCKGRNENVRKLIELGGKYQVPYLVDAETGVRMYESAEIVEYLEKRFGGGNRREA